MKVQSIQWFLKQIVFVEIVIIIHADVTMKLSQLTYLQKDEKKYIYYKFCVIESLNMQMRHFSYIFIYF